MGYWELGETGRREGGAEEGIGVGYGVMEMGGGEDEGQKRVSGYRGRIRG